MSPVQLTDICRTTYMYLVLIYKFHEPFHSLLIELNGTHMVVVLDTDGILVMVIVLV